MSPCPTLHHLWGWRQGVKWRRAIDLSWPLPFWMRALDYTCSIIRCWCWMTEMRCGRPSAATFSSSNTTTKRIIIRICQLFIVIVIVNQSVSQSVSQPASQPTNQSTNQPTNQTINQSINQSTNQKTNQSDFSLFRKGLPGSPGWHKREQGLQWQWSIEAK